MFSNINVYKSGIPHFFQHLKANKSENDYLLNVLTDWLMVGRGSVEALPGGQQQKEQRELLSLAY